jgi:4-amino-4-deoxy-L-arabinose transferase-like glycosyltransferase
MMAAYKHKETLGWGIVLIVIGLLFFLWNIDVDIWDIIAQLWPLILIAWGAWKFYFGLKERSEETEKEQS